MIDLDRFLDIVEKEKENEWSLGKSLYIGDEKFEDLDDIVANHVEQMSYLVQEILSNPKYLKHSKAEIGKSFERTQCM